MSKVADWLRRGGGGGKRGGYSKTQHIYMTTRHWFSSLKSTFYLFKNHSAFLRWKLDTTGHAVVDQYTSVFDRKSHPYLTSQSKYTYFQPMSGKTNHDSASTGFPALGTRSRAWNQLEVSRALRRLQSNLLITLFALIG